MNPRFALFMIPILSTAFGAVSGIALDSVLPLAVFGLVWGLVFAAIAPRLARWGARSRWADVPLYVAVALAFVVLGAGLLGNVLATDAEAQLDLLQQRAFGPFFYAIHGPFEWVLMPLLVAVNWHRRRRLLLAAATVFYLGRISSGVYFAPHAIDWANDPGSADASAVHQWTTLNWIRILLQDTTTAVLLLIASATRRDRG